MLWSFCTKVIGIDQSYWTLISENYFQSRHVKNSQGSLFKRIKKIVSNQHNNHDQSDKKYNIDVKSRCTWSMK
jgi:hypothetical protein